VDEGILQQFLGSSPLTIISPLPRKKAMEMRAEAGGYVEQCEISGSHGGEHEVQSM
jgi:hypothetical protein